MRILGNSRARFELLTTRLRIRPLPYLDFPSIIIDDRKLLGYASGTMRNLKRWIAFGELLKDLEAEITAPPFATRPAANVPRPLDASPAAYDQIEGEKAVSCLATDHNRRGGNIMVRVLLSNEHAYDSS